MRIIVCGAGQVGTTIARHLAREGNDVTVIDHVLGKAAVTAYKAHRQVLGGICRHLEVVNPGVEAVPGFGEHGYDLRARECLGLGSIDDEPILALAQERRLPEGL